MSQNYPIQVDGQVFTCADQTPENTEWLKALSGAHQQDVTFCHCNEHALVRLVVKRYGAGTPTVKYGLARWPDTGLDHQMDCAFFGEDEGTPTGSLSAFDELEDGNIRAHLSVSLTRSAEKGKAAEFARSLKQTPRKPNEEVAKRERATDLMLLQQLWRHARLNIFTGKQRTWFHASFAIIKAAKKIVINREGETLADYLYVCAPASDKMAGNHNEAVMMHVAATRSRMFVIGRLKPFKAEKDQTILPMVDNASTIKTLVKVALLEEAIGSTNFTKNILHSGSGAVIGLSTVEPAGTSWWKAVSVVTITTTNNMIPACSSAELEFEAHLCDAGRNFIKPIIVSQSPSAQSPLPHFVLLDTPKRVRCQIWGEKSECSIEEMERAEALAKASRTDIVMWSSNPRKPFPDLPQPGCGERNV